MSFGTHKRSTGNARSIVLSCSVSFNAYSYHSTRVIEQLLGTGHCVRASLVCFSAPCLLSVSPDVRRLETRASPVGQPQH